MGGAGKDREVGRMKSPCVKDCPDRLPCGTCRKSCEAFRVYEAQRLEEKPWVDQANTAARERYVRQSARYATDGKRHMR